MRKTKKEARAALVAACKDSERKETTMKIEITVKKKDDEYDDEYDVEQCTSGDAMLYDYIAAICHMTHLLAKYMAEQDGVSLEGAEHTILDIVQEVLENNRR